MLGLEQAIRVADEIVVRIGQENTIPNWTLNDILNREDCLVIDILKIQLLDRIDDFVKPNMLHIII